MDGSIGSSSNSTSSSSSSTSSGSSSTGSNSSSTSTPTPVLEECWLLYWYLVKASDIGEVVPRLETNHHTDLFLLQTTRWADQEGRRQCAHAR